MDDKKILIIYKIIADNLNIEIKNITPESSFENDLGADSLDLMELIMAMEEEFDLSISDEDGEKLLTVGDILKYISKHT